MAPIAFQAEIDDEQVIRPPANIHLPTGVVEVVVRAIEAEPSAKAVKAANAALRLGRVSLGYPTGVDNEGIDADLAREYGNEIEPKLPDGRA